MNTSLFLKSINASLSILMLALLLGFTACQQASEKEAESKTTALEDKVMNTSNEAANTADDSKKDASTATIATDGKGEIAIDPKNAPVFSFDKTEFNFGEAKEGDVVKHVFTFTNTGKSPLIIANASASCGCTVPVWPKEPIAPGQKSQINVEFSTEGKTGMQNKTVTITANTSPAITTLKVTGTVKGSGNTNMIGPVKQ